MLRGTVERRIDPRVSCAADLAIELVRDEKKRILGTTSNLSPGGLEFHVPWGSSAAYVGEIIHLTFRLAGEREIKIKCQVRHERSGAQAGDNPELYYGVKFLDLREEDWHQIVAFCQENAMTENLDLMGGSPFGERGGLTALSKTMRKGRPIGVEIPAKVQGESVEPIMGRVEDAGFGGLEISLSRAVEPGLPFRINLDQGQIHLDAEGECVWCHGFDDERLPYLAGFRLRQEARDLFNQMRALILILVRSTHGTEHG